MNVQGEIVCLHCGHANGNWAGVAGEPLTYRGCAAAPQGTAPGDPVRCQRCGRSVYLDAATHTSTSARARRIRLLRRQLAAWDDEAA